MNLRGSDGHHSCRVLFDKVLWHAADDQKAVWNLGADPATPATARDRQARDAVPAAYRHPLVLCRADQHVVWRGEAVPADAAALVAVLRGAGVKPAEARTPAPAAVLETEPHG